MILTDTEACTGYTIGYTGQPSDLWLIDGKMRTRRAIETLFIQDIAVIGRLQRLGFNLPVS